MNYYDRDGCPLTLDEFSRLHEDPSYRTVQQDDVATPSGQMAFVSTDWLGVNYGLRNCPPLMFETMVFLTDEAAMYCRRYGSEYEALVSHCAIVDRLRQGVKVPELNASWR